MFTTRLINNCFTNLATFFISLSSLRKTPINYDKKIHLPTYSIYLFNYKFLYHDGQRPSKIGSKRLQ